MSVSSTWSSTCYHDEITPCHLISCTSPHVDRATRRKTCVRHHEMITVMPHMAHDVHIYVGKCPDVWGHWWHSNHQRLLILFPTDGPLVFVAVDVLGPLSKSKSGHCFYVVVTNYFAELPRTVPTKMTTAAHISRIFLDACIMPYGIPELFLTGDGPYSTGIFFNA